jgi:hypothetical protein
MVSSGHRCRVGSLFFAMWAFAALRLPLFHAASQHAFYEIVVMSDAEDYPGPSDDPAKKGQDPHGRATEKMVKPPADGKPEQEKPRKQKPSR